MALDIPALKGVKEETSGEALITLIEVEYEDGEFVRFARYDQPVTFDGEVWSPFPIQSAQTRQAIGTEMQTSDIVLSGVGREMVEIFETTEIEGRPGRILRVHPDHLDDPTACVEEPFTIAYARVNSRDAVITISPLPFNPLDVMVPRRKVSAAEFPGILGTFGRPF